MLNNNQMQSSRPVRHRIYSFVSTPIFNTNFIKSAKSIYHLKYAFFNYYNDRYVMGYVRFFNAASETACKAIFYDENILVTPSCTVDMDNIWPNTATITDGPYLVTGGELIANDTASVEAATDIDEMMNLKNIILCQHIPQSNLMMWFSDLYTKYKDFIQVLYKEKEREHDNIYYVPTIYFISTNITDIGIRKLFNSIFKTTEKYSFSLENINDWENKYNNNPIVDYTLRDMNSLSNIIFKDLIEGRCGVQQLGCTSMPYVVNILHTYDGENALYDNINEMVMDFSKVYIDIYKSGDVVHFSAKNALSSVMKDISFTIEGETSSTNILKAIGKKLKLQDRKQLHCYSTIALLQ